MPKFRPITNPYMRGVKGERNDGILVEVVQCYEGEWDVFLVGEDGHVVACPLPLPGYRPHQNMSRSAAMRLARSLL